VEKRRSELFHILDEMKHPSPALYEALILLDVSRLCSREQFSPEFDRAMGLVSEVFKDPYFHPPTMGNWRALYPGPPMGRAEEPFREHFLKRRFFIAFEDLLCYTRIHPVDSAEVTSTEGIKMFTEH
jgi:hypothetical protein